MGLFRKNLDGYKGTVVYVPMTSIDKEAQRDLTEHMIMLVAHNCQIAINAEKREFAIWIPDGFSTVTVQLWMFRYRYEIIA